jgi:hypothetical protein
VIRSELKTVFQKAACWADYWAVQWVDLMEHHSVEEKVRQWVGSRADKMDHTMVYHWAVPTEHKTACRWARQSVVQTEHQLADHLAVQKEPSTELSMAHHSAVRMEHQTVPYWVALKALQMEHKTAWR